MVNNDLQIRKIDLENPVMRYSGIKTDVLLRTTRSSFKIAMKRTGIMAKQIYVKEYFRMNSNRLLFVVNVLRGHTGLYRLSRLYSIPRSRIVSPYYGGTVHSGLELITSVLLDRSS